MLLCLNSSLFGISESLLNLVPVDNFPNFLEEISLVVLVVNVKSMLPDINGQKRSDISLEISNEVLVSCGSILKVVSLLVVNKPSPA